LLRRPRLAPAVLRWGAASGLRRRLSHVLAAVLDSPVARSETVSALDWVMYAAGFCLSNHPACEPLPGLRQGDAQVAPCLPRRAPAVRQLARPIPPETRTARRPVPVMTEAQNKTPSCRGGAVCGWHPDCQLSWQTYGAPGISSWSFNPSGGRSGLERGGPSAGGFVRARRRGPVPIRWCRRARLGSVPGTGHAGRTHLLR
jgi:hypothetical protein